MRILARSTLAALALAAGLAASSSAFAFQRWIDIYNDGHCSILTVQITHVDDPDRGRDLLGRHVIPVGDIMRVEPDSNEGYCRFDVLITYEDGSEVALWGVNLCAAETIVADGDDGYVS